MWQHRLTRPLHTVYGNSQTKLILYYFKRGSTLNLNVFSVKIFFLHKILGIFEFFICSCKITCKPMGKFAENLNLGKRVRPPWFSLWPGLLLTGSLKARNIHGILESVWPEGGIRIAIPFKILFCLFIYLFIFLLYGIITNHIEPILTRTNHSGVARGQGEWLPPGRNSAPLPPKWNYILYRGLWRAAILSSSQPPCSPLSPPCRPLILKSLANLTVLHREVNNRLSEWAFAHL